MCILDKVSLFFKVRNVRESKRSSSQCLIPTSSHQAPEPEIWQTMTKRKQTFFWWWCHLQCVTPNKTNITVQCEPTSVLPHPSSQLTKEVKMMEVVVLRLSCSSRRIPASSLRGGRLLKVWGQYTSATPVPSLLLQGGQQSNATDL